MRYLERKVAIYEQTWTRYSRENPKGSGYCEDQGVIVTLRERAYLFGVCIRDKILDSEDMPSFAWIQKATLGSTDWKPRFADDSRLT